MKKKASLLPLTWLGSNAYVWTLFKSRFGLITWRLYICVGRRRPKIPEAGRSLRHLATRLTVKSVNKMGLTETNIVKYVVFSFNLLFVVSLILCAEVLQRPFTQRPTHLFLLRGERALRLLFWVQTCATLTGDILHDNMWQTSFASGNRGEKDCD